MDGFVCGPVRCTPGFLFLAALLFYRGTPPFLLSFLLAAALHEAAHLAVAGLLGVPMRSLSLTAFGCVLSLEDRAVLPNRTVFLIAAAGPLANLAAATGVSSLPIAQGALFRAENLLLALFNLLPVFPLDGAVLLSTALSAWLKPGRAEQLTGGLSLLLAAGAAAAAAGMGGSACLRLLLFALWAAAGTVRKLGLSFPRLSGTIKKSVK